VGKETKTFGITRAHLEEDAGWKFACDAMCAYKKSPVQSRNLCSFPFPNDNLAYCSHTQIMHTMACIQWHAYNVMHAMSCMQCHAYYVMRTISCI